MNSNPRLIQFNSNGEISEGFLHIADIATHVPFEIKRVFWTVDTPTNVVRGRHAHYHTEMVLVAIRGNIDVTTISKSGVEEVFSLKTSNVGLYLPKMCWHEMKYDDGAVQLVLASTFYDEKDYIRDKTEFIHILQRQ